MSRIISLFDMTLRHAYTANLLIRHISRGYVQEQLGHHFFFMTRTFTGIGYRKKGDLLDLASRPQGKPGTLLALMQGQ